MMAEEDYSQGPAAGESPEARGSEARMQRRDSRNGAPSASSAFADLNTERAVVAALLIEPTCISTVLTILGGISAEEAAGQKKKSRDVDSLKRSAFHGQSAMIFYDPKHAAVYEAILDLSEKGVGIDVLSVSDYLERNSKLEVIGGQEYLLEIQSSIVSTANVESWCHTLRDYAMLREMIRTCSAAVDMCRNTTEDVKSLLDTIESEIFKVRNRFVQPEVRDLRGLMQETFEYFMRVYNREIDPGIPTEYPDLDALIGGGLKPGEMFVLAARPSIGKTAIALNIVRNIMMKDIGGKRKTVAFFSLEMSAEQVAQRLLCTESHVSISSIMDRNLKPGDSSRLSAAATSLKNARLFIDPTAGISVFELRAKARKLHDQHKLDLIVIDYLQLMKSGDAAGKDSRQVEVAAISGGLKKLAKDLGLPVLVLAQLNREVEKGAGPANARPKLSHLRESGAIEQDADVVVFLHRNRDDAKESNPEANKVGVDAELIVEKNRNGKTGIVKLKFFPALMEFRSMEHRYGDSDVPAANSPK